MTTKKDALSAHIQYNRNIFLGRREAECRNRIGPIDKVTNCYDSKIKKGVQNRQKSL